MSSYWSKEKSNSRFKKSTTANRSPISGIFASLFRWMLDWGLATLKFGMVSAVEVLDYGCLFDGAAIETVYCRRSWIFVYVACLFEWDWVPLFVSLLVLWVTCRSIASFGCGISSLVTIMHIWSPVSTWTKWTEALGTLLVLFVMKLVDLLQFICTSAESEKRGATVQMMDMWRARIRESSRFGCGDWLLCVQCHLPIRFQTAGRFLDGMLRSKRFMLVRFSPKHPISICSLSTWTMDLSHLNSNWSLISTDLANKDYAAHFSSPQWNTLFGGWFSL